MEENKMGVMPVNKLLISMALPMMISMLVQAIYNIVDSMFVAQIQSRLIHTEADRCWQLGLRVRRFFLQENGKPVH